MGKLPGEERRPLKQGPVPQGFLEDSRSHLKVVSRWEQGCCSIYLHLHVSLWFRAIPGVRGVNPQALLASLTHKAKQVSAA